MKCHICYKNLPIIAASPCHYHYFCQGHLILHFANDKCYLYSLTSFDEDVTTSLVGDKDNNQTSIQNYNSLEFLITVNYIPIDTNNIAKETSRIYNKLMKLKAFA